MIWLLKNWKLVAFGAVVLALVVTGVKLYRAGASNATLAFELDASRKANELLWDKIKNRDEAAKAHVERTIADAQKITELNQRITSLNDYVDTLQDRDRECLSGPDVERLRDLWNNSGSGTGTSASAPR